MYACCLNSEQNFLGTAVPSQHTLYLCGPAGDRRSPATQVTICTHLSFHVSPPTASCLSSDVVFSVNRLTQEATLTPFNAAFHKGPESLLCPAPSPHSRLPGTRLNSTVYTCAVGHFRICSVSCQQNYLCMPVLRGQRESGRVLSFFSDPTQNLPEGAAEF